MMQEPRCATLASIISGGPFKHLTQNADKPVLCVDSVIRPLALPSVTAGGPFEGGSFQDVADFHTQSLGFCPSLTPRMFSHTLFSGCWKLF